MYLTLLSLAVAIAVGVIAKLLGAGWFLTGLFGFVGFVVTWIVGVRRLQKRIAPAMLQVQRQMEAQMPQAALSTMKDLLRYGDWMPLLKGQLHAQIGILEHMRGQQAEALVHLEKAGRRSAEAQALLASIRYRDGRKAEALRGLEVAERLARRNALLHNLHAWLLVKEGRVDDALAVLNRLLKKEPGNEVTRDNLLRLQNGQKLNMKALGMGWYVLGFERPPASMGEMRPVRKGFRQPPKRRG